MYALWELDHKKSWALKNWCFWTVVLEKTLESPLDCKEIKPVHPLETSLEYSLEDWCWSWNSNTLATWCEELTHWQRPWCWERLKAGGEGDDRGWDGWMASLTQWTWVWVDSGSWWWIGKTGMLQSMGSQRIGHDWVTELTDWLDCNSPGSSLHGISQARILEWVAISFSRGSSWPRDPTCISCTAGRFFTSEPPGKP